MGNRHRKQAPHPRRLRLSSVRALELWDLLTERGPLWECRDLPAFPTLLMRAIDDVLAGKARRAGGPPPPEDCRRIGHLFLGGGGSHAPGLAEALERGPLPFCLSADGAFVGEAGGLALLCQAGLAGLVVDVGQTAIKVSTLSRRLLVPRCFEQLPVGAADGLARQALRDLVAGAIRQALPFPVEAIVLALPCELDEDCLPGPCSYACLEGDDTFIEEVLRAAGLEGVPAFILNDAELAAASARLSPDVPADRVTLVLTLGFGVGAALLMPEDAHVV
jgi:hypothetical protein